MSDSERAQLRWWGWGESAKKHELSPSTLTLLREQLGLESRTCTPIELEEISLPVVAFSAQLREQLVAIVGEEGVRDDHLARVAHAAGKSYPDLVRQRMGVCVHAPDAVIYPANAEQVSALLALCQREGVAVVPFGGGTSVVGGVDPLRGTFENVITLDLARMRDLVALDRTSLVAQVAPGTRGPELEKELASHDLTLGHFPQSYEFATIGGYVATRSAGQASTGYGRIDELVRGLRLTAPAGEISLPPRPRSAAGPELRELIVGSEGAFGVLTDLYLSVRPRPESRQYEGLLFRDFEQGAQALRTLEQAGLAPTVTRLSDERETEITLLMSDRGRLKDRVGRKYIATRGFGGGCLAIFGWEGEAGRVHGRRRAARELLARYRTLDLGCSVGSAWLKGRFDGPYLRDLLLDHGVLVETLETAAKWSDLMALYQAVRRALNDSLSACDTPPIVFCHISHLYPVGASLYFTFLAAQQQGAEIEQWQAAKDAACAAVVATGGTITHHHAIGRDHARWLPDEVGSLGVDALRAVKERFDPAGIMNPGKLLSGE